MIEFTESDVSNVIADVTMMLDAAVPEYQRLRAEFVTVTDAALGEMRRRIAKGPPFRLEENTDPLVYNFARFQLAHAAATYNRDLLRKGRPEAEAVRRAYLGACDAMAALGAVLREVKGVIYAASYFRDYTSQLVKHHKTSRRGHENRTAANEQREVEANETALAAVRAWRKDPIRKARLNGRSETDVVSQYLAHGRPPDRQARRLRALLKAGRLKK